MSYSSSQGDVMTLEDAQKVWAYVFNSTPYTNFFQIEYLLKKLGITWKELLLDPKILSKRIKNLNIDKDGSYAFNETWAHAGRCTSFAIRVTKQLQANLNELDTKYFDFKFYDLKHHRVARCAKTGILIDSSSAVGILILKNGEWETLEDDNARWKWIDGKSKFERGSVLKTSAEDISVERCMTTCLTEVMERFKIDTLYDPFRLPDGYHNVEDLNRIGSFTASRAAYHGMIKWIPKAREVHSIKDLKSQSKEVIVFDKNGTIETEKKCRSTVSEFVRKHSGPSGPYQGGTGISQELWEAACAPEVWGLPRLKKDSE